MAKEKHTEISVKTVFDGKQSQQAAFIDLILHKEKAIAKAKNIDGNAQGLYNDNKVFSNVHVD